MKSHQHARVIHLHSSKSAPALFWDFWRKSQLVEELSLIYHMWNLISCPLCPESFDVWFFFFFFRFPRVLLLTTNVHHGSITNFYWCKNDEATTDYRFYFVCVWRGWGLFTKNSTSTSHLLSLNKIGYPIFVNSDVQTRISLKIFLSGLVTSRSACEFCQINLQVI
jgi:hypothetical protein